MCERSAPGGDRNVNKTGICRSDFLARGLTFLGGLILYKDSSANW